jgi:hypothetical protein
MSTSGAAHHRPSVRDGRPVSFGDDVGKFGVQVGKSPPELGDGGLQMGAEVLLVVLVTVHRVSGERLVPDILWALTSPDIHRLLTDQRHWPADRYRQWLADAVQRLLFD